MSTGWTIFLVIWLVAGLRLTIGVLRMTVHSYRESIAEGKLTEPQEEFGLLVYTDRVQIRRFGFFATSAALLTVAGPAIVPYMILADS